MKILVVCQYYYPEPFRITDICESLVSNGNEVTVLTGLPNYPEGRVPNEYRYGKNRYETINGIRVIRSFELGRGHGKLKLFLNYFSFAISGSLKALLIKEKFDVVFVNQLSPVMMAIPAIVYKMKHQTKLLLYCLDLWPASLAAGGINENSLIHAAFLKLSQWIYRRSDYTLVTSNMFVDYLETKMGMNPNNIGHLPQYAEDIFSQQLNSNSKRAGFNFVFAGNIGDMQSVETIIRAAAELKSRTDITFHIVGDGSKFDECKDIANNLDAENINFHGRKPVEEMPKFYEMADAMLITLKNNEIISSTLPGKVQSYMAAGKPIIGSINGETKHIIEEADCGLCCEAENYKELAKLIIQFCEGDKKELMGINAKQFYLDYYRKEKFMFKLEDALQQLLNNVY